MSHRQRRLPIPRRVSSVSASSSDTSTRAVSRDRFPTVDRILDGHNTPARAADSRTRAEHSLQTSPDVGPTTGNVALSSISETAFHEPLLHVPPSSEVESSLSQHELRQRASSPLLGQSCSRHRASYSPGPFQPKPNPLRVSESASASTLRSFYDPQHSPAPTSDEETNAAEPSGLALRDYFPTPPTSHSATELDSSNDDMNFPRKERRLSSKPKTRPPMIDLSKLFPKPRQPSVPLLSPNRMTASPSPVSVISDESTTRTTLKFERLYKSGNENKLSKGPGNKDSMLLRKQQKQQEQLLRQEQDAQMIEQQQRQQKQLEREREKELERERQLQLEKLLRQQQKLKQKQHRQSGMKIEHLTQRIPKPFRTQDTENSGVSNTKIRRPALSYWFDGPEGQVSDEDDDGNSFDFASEEEQISELPSGIKQTFCDSVYSHANSFASSVTSNAESGFSRSSSRTLQIPPSSYLMGSNRRRASSGHTNSGPTRSTSSREWESRGRPSAQKLEPTSSAKKRSTIAFNTPNLNESSVLCLSSSDEEEEDDDHSKTGNKTFMRDSIASFDEGEICTAQAAIATPRRPSIRRVKPNGSTQNRSSRPVEGVRHPLRRNPSISSSTLSSNVARVNGSSAVPTISEPAISSPKSSAKSFDFHLPRPRSRASDKQAADRRSRYLAVTRQEEYLLEILRKHKGSIPRHLFPNDDENFASSNPDGKTVNRQSLASYYSDMSFLKLSPNMPPSRRPSQIQTPTRPWTSSPSHADGSEYGDMSTDRSTVSPRASLIHSDAMTSPSTGLASPRTPSTTTSSLVNHRISLVNPHPPPSFSPPPVPEQHRHSRRRTDSSNALVFGSNGDREKETHMDDDLPIWALGWNQEFTGLAVAH